MMSHLHQHPQHPLLLHQHPESSLSSFHAINKANNKKKKNSIRRSDGSFLGHKFVSSSITSFSNHNNNNKNNSNEGDEGSPPTTTQQCCFNVYSSRRWGANTNIVGCSEVSSSMASQLEPPSSSLLRSPSNDIIRKKKISGQQKKEELEREMKELLAELVMVEGEISRLEIQINHLQTSLKHEQEITKETKSKSWNLSNNNNSGSYNVNNHHHHFPTSAPIPIPIPSPIHHRSSVHERMAYETKALHFISKAIKGDYYALNSNNNELSSSLNEKTGFMMMMKNSVEQKENNNNNKFHQERVVGRKINNGMVKAPSPMRDPRHPSPKLRERNPEMYLDLPTRSLLDPLLSEENDLKWQPNKLSESIMKCLNFIYVRLLRTSRAMELEKSGPILRSMHSSLSSRSFRVDTTSNTKSNLMLQREARQQDPYAIFDTEESIPRDIGPYKNLVIFTSSSMDPKFISNPSSIPLLRKLRILMSNLQTVDLKCLTCQQKLAFWINVYNACIMHGFIQYGVPSTPEKLLALMNKATLNIGGNIINAQEIEHFILRKRATSNIKEVQRKGEREDKESKIGELYEVESIDPNVTFALCCGTRSSPAVRIYTSEGVTSELEKSKLDYLQASILATSTKRIGFPELLLRNMHDFASDIDSLVDWVCNQLPTSGTLRKSMVDCFRTNNNNNNVKASTIVDKIPYDYEFQYLLTI
ncbi:hypothetical protein Ahy_A03g016914 isoform B [Arachis hypogaea]|uniref:DUF547 domain-containing protein n=1 Tax=Arachis hypogaea TaxID=3818 RepID=A0A445E4V9_ARAHY|nr:hypothetical protein Ahy_A03g016914 isoform B [Arachis hypogaea]